MGPLEWAISMVTKAAPAAAKWVWSKATMFFSTFRKNRAAEKEQQRIMDVMEARRIRKRDEVVVYRGIPWTASEAPAEMHEGNVPFCPVCWRTRTRTTLQVFATLDGRIRFECPTKLHLEEPFEDYWSRHHYDLAVDNAEIRERTLRAR